MVNKLRRYRRYFVYPIILSALLVATPANVGADGFLNALGVFIALSGQALRLWALAARPESPGLRIHGPYAFIRHPLYVGNYLIALGLLIVFNSLPSYLIVLSSLALLYWKVAKEEEESLQRKFGPKYKAYLHEVHPLLPVRRHAPKGEGPVAFGWRRALIKEQGSICGLLAGAIALEFYEELLAGELKEIPEITIYLGSSLFLGVLSGVLYLQKKKEF